MRRSIFLLILLAAACSDDPSSPPDSPPPGGGGGGLAVTVGDNSFGPANLSVKAGQTVRWTWNGQNPHNVTFPAGPNSATQDAGTFERSFDTPGTFNYQCTVHGASMSGRVTVTE